MSQSVTHTRAIGFALLGFALWVLSDSCIKLAGEAALPPYEIIGFFGLSGTLTILLKNGLKKERRRFLNDLRPKKMRGQILRGLLVLALNVFNIIALRHLPLTIFYVMAFLSPLLIPVMAFFILDEKMNRKKIAAILVGFAGVLVAARPDATTAHGDWIGYVMMILAALTFSANAVWLRHMTRTETMDSIVFFTAVVEMVAGFIPMLWNPVPIGFYLLMILTAAGVFSVLGNLYNCAALKYTTAANVAQFHYTQIVTGALIGYLVWNEKPGWSLFAGAALIIGSGLYIAAHARKTENLAAINVAGKPT